MILIDTREQLPLWEETEGAIKYQKLDEGDYTTTELLGKAHIERKSGCDLYGSIIQGHKRFRNEIQRAIDKKITLSVFVECSKADFVGKKFKGGYRLKAKPHVLRKIVTTIQDKYGIEFHWCKDRDDLRRQMLDWFINQRRIMCMENNGTKSEEHNIPGCE